MPRTVRLLSMKEVVAEFVPDGQQLLMGGFAFSDPTAFAHELIRQQRVGLEVWKTSGGLVVDQLIGSGCIERLVFCHVWNSVGPEPAHAFRRAEQHHEPHAIRIDELSYGMFTMGLAAAAWGLPFMPTTPSTLGGHDLHRRLWPDKTATVHSPFEAGQLVTVVKPIRPVLGIFHVQRVDEHGNGQMFGPVAEFRQAIAACEQVILIADEMVDTEVVRERPEITVAPGFMVDAVVVQPWAAHPTDSAGYYGRDLDHHVLYGEQSRTVEGMANYLEEWVHATADHDGYIRHLGDERLGALSLRGRWW